jgi:hypothetical protein
MGDINKVTTGQKVSFKAETFNTIADTVNLINRSRGRTGAPDAKRGGGGNTIFVQNNSGADVLRGHVLGIDSPIMAPSTDLDEFLTRVSFNGVTPVAGTHEGKFIVCLDKIADGDTGPGCITGTCHAKVNFINADDPCAEIEDGETVLKSGALGAKILWKESGTGEKWAVMQLSAGNVGQTIYKATAEQSGTTVTAKRIEQDGTVGIEETLDVFSTDVIFPVHNNDLLMATLDGAGKKMYMPFYGSAGSPFVVPRGYGFAAETTTWDITDQPDSSLGVIVEAWSRTYWSGNISDPVYQFQRQGTYAPYIGLVAVGEEERRQIAPTDDCEEGS